MARPKQPQSTPPPTDPPLIASCHCGRVKLQVPAKGLGHTMNECHCTVCYKYGALWMYYTRKDVVVTVAPDTKIEKYIRDDEEGIISFNRCGHCGCMTHWWGVGKLLGDHRAMGVNFRMLPEEDIGRFAKKVSAGPGSSAESSENEHEG